MLLEHVGLIGNCQASALVHRSGEIVWCCLPRFDSAPVFFDEKAGGKFFVGLVGGKRGEQIYIENTNILETRFSRPSV